MTVRTVSEFTAGLAKWFENQKAFAGAAISGEISGLKETTGGHVSFTLKDRVATLSCIVWQSKVRNLPALKNGSAVIARGDVRLQGERSSYQMIVDTVELTGIGELFAKFEALKEQYRLEGLYDAQRKRQVPQFVSRIALVTSKTGDAYHDFMSEIHKQAPFIHVEFIHTRVQGEGASIDIAQALDEANRLNVDVIVLARGGGSFEDLFSFNEVPVVQAIVRSKHPVITAIGHQVNQHLADLVGDASYGTPSKAVEAIVRVWVQTRERVTRAQHDLRRAIDNALGTRSQRIQLRRAQLDGVVASRVSAAERRLVGLERRLSAKSPIQSVADQLRAVVGKRARLDALAQRLMNGNQRRYELNTARLQALDPNAPLTRGYALVMRGGAVVRSATDVAPGDRIEARLGHGTLDAVVERVRNE